MIRVRVRVNNIFKVRLIPYSKVRVNKPKSKSKS